MNNFSEKVSFIWSVADLLRGDYKQSEYGRVILPFLVLRRLDQVLAPSREAVLAAAANLMGYIHGFSKNVRDIMEKFRFDEQVTRLDNANLLFGVLRKFVALDLDPHARRPDGSPALGDDGKPLPNVSNLEMGTIFEELIASICDPACGTGGMLSVAEEFVESERLCVEPQRPAGFGGLPGTQPPSLHHMPDWQSFEVLHLSLQAKSTQRPEPHTPSEVHPSMQIPSFPPGPRRQM